MRSRSGSVTDSLRGLARRMSRSSSEDRGTKESFHFLLRTANEPCAVGADAVQNLHSVMLQQERELGWEALQAQARVDLDGACSTVSGFLLLGRAALFFYKGAGASKDDLIAFVPFPWLAAYAVRVLGDHEGGGASHGLELRFKADSTGYTRPPLLVMSKAGSVLSEAVAQALLVFVDTSVLRHARQLFELRQLAAVGVVASAGAEDATAASDENVTALVFDKRALRMPNSISSLQIFVPGPRHVAEWLLTYLKKAGASTPVTPIVCCFAPSGVLMMLPVQQLLVPLFWSELSSFKVKKDLFTFTHKVGEDAPQYWTIRSPNPAAMLESVQAAQQQRMLVASKPFPALYPPPRASEKALAMPELPKPEEEQQRNESVAKLQQERAARHLEQRAASGEGEDRRRSRGQLVVNGRRVARGAKTSVTDVMGPQEDVEIAVPTENVEARRERRREKGESAKARPPVEGQSFAMRFLDQALGVEEVQGQKFAQKFFEDTAVGDESDDE